MTTSLRLALLPLLALLLLASGCGEGGGDADTAAGDTATGGGGDAGGGDAGGTTGGTTGETTGGGTGGDDAEGGRDGDTEGGATEPSPGAGTTGSSGEDVAEGGGEADGGTTGEPTDTTPPPPVQAGLLTAGDHDDQLNAAAYQRYASDFLQRAGEGASFPFLELERRIALQVSDADGAPYGGARVRVVAGQDTLVELRTPATGTLYLYPRLDALPETFALETSDRLGDVMTSREVSLEALEESRRIDVALPATATDADELDLMLVLDTTGSMGDELDYLKAELRSILGAITDDNPGLDLRSALVFYRDVGDRYVVRTHEFTGDLERVRSTIEGESHDGGGDYPEAMDRALEAALGLGWRERSAKVMLLVADAPPHLDRVEATWAAARQARSRQIHIAPVAASGVADEAEYLMRTMAALTQSRYLFLTDDSGIGNPHQEPSIECYLVTRLDGLIVRVVDSLVGGTRVEPEEGEILRRVGNYDEGRCLSDAQ